MALRPVDKATGRGLGPVSAAGEGRRDARRVRECREVEQAINKGHRNRAMEDFLKHRGAPD